MNDEPKPTEGTSRPLEPQPRPELAETEPWQGESHQDASSGAPQRIGRYRIVGVLGHGGFGTVYRAHDEELERDVAIKVWRHDRFTGEEQVRRLLEEARTVAHLEKHPWIVKVHDVGRQEDGSCFVVLEYIDGHPLDQELRSHNLTPDRIWEIIIQVTSAIQHAHAQGLVHRDLKPSNVLLDADGNAHVADFGLAIDEQTQRFHAGEVSGTPSYMAPEQVRGEAHRLDGRTDIWALGVMLYEMLTHRRPFRGETHEELYDEILHREPKPPRQLAPQIPAELERICLKCLTRTITERYLTAADLAEDLRRAREAPARRRRRFATAGAVAAALLLIASAVGAYFVFSRDEPTIRVNPEADLEIRHLSTLRGHTGEVWTVAFAPGDQTLASAGVDKVIKFWDVQGSQERQQLTGHRGEVRCVTFAPDGQTLAAAASDHTITLWELQTGRPFREITGHDSDVRSVVFLPDGQRLVSGSVDKTLRLWATPSGDAERALDAHQAAVVCVACSADGAKLASASDDQAIRLYDAASGDPRATLSGHTDGVCHVAFSPDATTLASASWDRTIGLWDVASGALRRTIKGHRDAVRCVVFSPDGKRLASGGNDQAIKLWDAQSGKELATLRGHKGPVTSLAFSSDGRILASASGDKTVAMWQLEAASRSKAKDRSAVAARTKAGSKSTMFPSTPAPGQESTPGTKQETPSSKQDLAPIKQPSGTEAKATGEPATATKTAAGTTPEATSYEAIGPQATELKPAEWVPLAIERDLPAKKTTAAAKWSAAGGVLKGEGLVGWVATEHEFADFEFSFEYRLGKDGHAGIFLRAAADGPPDASGFLRIPLLDDTSPRFSSAGPMERTAAVFRTAAPSPPVKGTPDVWHAMTIRAEGPRIRVQYEGRTVVDVDLEKAKTGISGHRRASGRIGLQNLGTWVEFRNLVVRRLRRLEVARGPSAPPPLAIAPFDAATARKHQEAWAKYLGVPVEMTNSIGMRFMLIPPGEFDMGSTEVEVAKVLEDAKAAKQPQWYMDQLPAEAPKHRVRITKPFWLGRHEVTRAQFRRFVDDRGYRTEAERDGKGGVGYVKSQWVQNPRFVWNRDLGVEQADDHPVVNVSWNDAMAFCAWLSEKEGKMSQLPTEAQWEYACRAGTATTWYWGDDEGALKEHAWFSANAGGKTQRVGQKSSNAWGLYDMHGNVWEWCQDWFGDRYYATSSIDDPSGRSGGSFRVARGGAWTRDASTGRASVRNGDLSGRRYDDRGFRVARSVSSTDSGPPSPQKSGAESPQSKHGPTPKPSAPATTASATKPAPPWSVPAGSPAPAIAPFDEKKAKEHQAAWAKHLGVPIEMINSIGMKFMLIPPGEFDMGSTEAEVAKLLEQAKATKQPDWYIERLPTLAPKHHVRITKPFYLGQCEVTQAEYERVMGKNPSTFKGDPTREGKGVGSLFS
jgi:formylglycine-generating enzyme required for sulfatase activity/WD40 repeat protein/serine/threonine protein kinase